MISSTNIEDKRRTKTCENLFGKVRNMKELTEQKGREKWNSRKENKNKIFNEKRFGISNQKKKDEIKEINSNTDIIMKQEEEKSSNIKNDTVCWSICKNVINIKEFLISHKSLNLKNEFETHKDKINKILEEVEKFKVQKLKITQRELNKSIIFDRYKTNSG